MLHLTGVLAHLLDVNTAKHKVSKHGRKSWGAEVEPAMYEF